jgi:purine-binding chemotaxis protein CheW
MTGRDETKRILKARAQALAREPVKRLAEPLVEVVEFQLAHERYAVETAFLREVQPLLALTPVPCTPAFLRGIINVRGRILAVIDLKQFFALPEEGLHDLRKVLIVQAAGMEIGLLADEVAGNRSIPASALQPALPTLTGIRVDYLKGVTADRLVLLDAGKILADPRIVIQEEVAP